ncbi:MAG TPA: DUF3422 domain-containing protein [Xanthobacteraceae bacterium]|nr:DUF3422 domain-containing protein [Xanthobacteraceae bacterium]
MNEAGAAIGTDKALGAHPLRAEVLGELHARPFTPIATPRRVLHFAFMRGTDARGDRAALEALCRSKGMTPPPEGARHMRWQFDGGAMRWESHNEFSTYRWELPSENGKPFEPAARVAAKTLDGFMQPGPLMVAIDLHLIADPDGKFSPESVFERASLAVAENSDGAALFATDFLVDADGYVRVVVADRGMGPERAGALVQRVLELETYRTLALLGLPEAQRLSPSIGRIEKKLADVTEAMRHATGLIDNSRLLDELTALASDLEADAAASLFRFGATRAYYEIVQTRLQAIGERKFGGLPTWTSFLTRRMAPAMRTCLTMEERQANMSRKLARAANLLRTRVNVAVEGQNRDLLSAMNKRARMQLRLQQTVEGLSVAAISYYLVGLVHYVLEGAHHFGFRVDPTVGTAIAVPVVVLFVAFIVRRIRRKYDESAANEDKAG